MVLGATECSKEEVPVISEEYYQSGYFRFVGQLIAMLVLHSGNGIVGLSRALTRYMVTEDVELPSCNLSIDDFPDYCTTSSCGGTCTVGQVLDK